MPIRIQEHARVLAMMISGLLVTSGAIAKRLPPPKVNPISHGGMTYAALHVIGGKTKTGKSGFLAFVVATDTKTGKAAWKSKVYERVYKTGLETDVQDVWIKSIQVQGAALLVDNEHNQRFRLDLKSGKRIKPAPAPVAKHTPLPDTGKLVDGKPAGDGWVNMIDKLDGWNAEHEYWKLADGVLHGESKGGKHHHAWTKKNYKDFELHAVIRMSGKGANSGVCIRLHPTDPDNAPGYQVDMGPGYWGCLWEERRAGMVQRYPKELADKLVKGGGWNHYYILAKGHHIQAWLNGTRTIDVVHEEGFADGAIGFQLCHGKKETIVDVKALYIRELK